MAKGRQVQHANEVAAVLFQLRRRFPSLPLDSVQKLLLVVPRGGAPGCASPRDSVLTPGRMAIRSREYHESRAELWKKDQEDREAAGNIRYGVDYTFEGTIRHELGHTLTTENHVKALRKTPYGPSWARKNLSEYSGTNPKETLAEAFCEYTRPGYKKGSLPSLLEKILDDMVNGK